ncbi:hypothetical protein [Pseudochrobactrum asaccharolyticum]|nr:hypothetical protein [Pseudochrobactrum asaccharolyticum]
MRVIANSQSGYIRSDDHTAPAPFFAALSNHFDEWLSDTMFQPS